MENIILRCLECGELFCPTRYDKYPSYIFDQSDGVFHEQKVDELNVFTSAHSGHNIEELEIVDGSFCSNYPYWEPVREDYIKVEDGTDVFTVKRWRQNINEPLRYEVVNLDLVIGKPILSIQSESIKRQMIADSKLYGFDKALIELFICLFKSFVFQVNIDNLFESGFSMGNPMVSYAKMDEQSKEKFLRLCLRIVGSRRIDALRNFIDDNSEYDDVMNIQVERHFRLEPTSERITSKRV